MRGSREPHSFSCQCQLSGSPWRRVYAIRLQGAQQRNDFGSPLFMMARTTLPYSAHSFPPCRVLVLWRKYRSDASWGLLYIFHFTFPKGNLICEQSKHEILPYLVHRFQWFPEDNNRCIHEAMKHKLLLSTVMGGSCSGSQVEMVSVQNSPFHPVGQSQL